MKIDSITIKKFRGIDEIIGLKFKELSIIIGDNGTCKTAILEAINFALSPSFLSGRIKHTDFYNGQDIPIEIDLKFDDHFIARLPDGYNYQDVECNRIYLRIKKRDRAANSKAFSELVVIEHYVVPVAPRNGAGWEIPRKGSKSKFKFDIRQLSFPVTTENLLKSFYYGKNRNKQIQRGFNSTMSSVYDDFNWRFSKEIRKHTSPPAPFYNYKEQLEKNILDQIDKKQFDKTFEELNTKLKNLNLEPLEISFIDIDTPFDNAFLNQRIQNIEVPATSLGSGIEMITSLLFLETLARLSKDNIIVIIDEPELHLHPKLQHNFTNYLIDICKNVQVIINTHSPYIYKGCISKPYVELITTKKISRKIIINNNSNKGLFPWSPSWGEINFNAFSLPTIEFHNELYGYIQEKFNLTNEKAFESFVKSKRVKTSKKWIKSYNSTPQSPYDVSIMTFIRNSIHHPENTFNSSYTDAELEISINEMITLL